jgi:leucyl-tRNA synthetase
VKISKIHAFLIVFFLAGMAQLQAIVAPIRPADQARGLYVRKMQAAIKAVQPVYERLMATLASDAQQTDVAAVAQELCKTIKEQYAGMLAANALNSKCLMLVNQINAGMRREVVQATAQELYNLMQEVVQVPAVPHTGVTIKPPVYY